MCDCCLQLFREFIQVSISLDSNLQEAGGREEAVTISFGQFQAKRQPACDCNYMKDPKCGPPV